MTVRVTVLFTVACFFVRANSAKNIYADNGWRPMSNEKVFALQRNFIKTPIQIQNVPGNSMDNVLQRGSAIKIVKPEDVHLNKESIKAHEAISPLRSIERKGRAFEDQTYPVFEETLPQKYTNVERQRKSKKTAEQSVNLFTNNEIHNQMDIKEETSERKTENISTEPNNTYEVHESSTQNNLRTDQNNFKIMDTNIDNIAYKYEKPKSHLIQNKDLTSKLFSILANYNIRSGDKLPNYALSLRQNSRNSNNNDIVYMQVPIKIPFRYNSQNHYPIDPLLAVILSNYGHYLPGSYGFQRSYNNLYGYLASNNIHNNNIFGSYKIFSDTDSSH